MSPTKKFYRNGRLPEENRRDVVDKAFARLQELLAGIWHKQ
jgi:hypothetical protein